MFSVRANGLNVVLLLVALVLQLQTGMAFQQYADRSWCADDHEMVSHVTQQHLQPCLARQGGRHRTSRPCFMMHTTQHACRLPSGLSSPLPAVTVTLPFFSHLSSFLKRAPPA